MDNRPQPQHDLGARSGGRRGRGTVGLWSHERRRDRLTFVALVLPALALFALLILYPLLNMFQISRLDWNGLLRPQLDVGIANFRRLWSDGTFRAAVRNTIVHLVVAVPGVMVPAFILGFFLSLRPRGYRVLRFVFFVPAMLSVAARSLLFLGVYMPDGIINTMFRAVGLSALTRSWLGDPNTALLSVIGVNLWGGIGFYGVLFFAALSDMPSDLYEAAKLDGAGLWTIMRRITFPLARDFFGVAVTLQFLYILLDSSQVILLLTEGGPGNASMTLSYYLYDLAFVSRRLGYSQAVGVVLFVVGVVGLLGIRRASRARYLASA